MYKRISLLSVSIILFGLFLLPLEYIFHDSLALAISHLNLTSTPPPANAIGIVNFRSFPENANVVITKYPLRFPGGASIERPNPLPYGYYAVTFYLPGYLAQEVPFTVNLPEMTVSATLQPDPCWQRVPNPRKLEMRDWFFVDAELQESLKLYDGSESPLQVGKYFLTPIEHPLPPLPQTLTAQLARLSKATGLEYVFGPAPGQDFGFLFIFEPPNGFKEFRIADFTNLGSPIISQFTVPALSGGYWAQKGRAFLDHNVWVSERPGQEPPKFILYTFDAGLARLEAKDLLPNIKAVLPYARGFEPLAANDSLSNVLVRVRPNTSFLLYDHIIVDTQTGKVRQIAAEELSNEIMDAVWLHENVLLIYSQGSAILEYDTRTGNLKTIADLKDFGALGLWFPRFTPDGKYLVGQYSQQGDFLIFDMAHIYPPKR